MHGHMHTKASLPILLVLLMAFAGCHEPADSGDDTIRIGSLMPLTGPAASLGVPAAQGARLAVEEINADGGVRGVPLELIEGDTKFPETAEAAAAFDRLAGEGVQFIVGALASDSSETVKPKASAAQIVLMSPASTRPSLTGPDHGYFFRTIANDDVQGPQAAGLIYDDLGIESVVVMYQQTGYAEGLRDVFVPAFEALGGVVEGTPVAWADDAATFDAKAAEAIGHVENSELIWIAGQAPEIANLIKSLRSQGFEGTIMTSEAIEAQEIFDVAGADVDGVLFTKSGPDPNSARYKAFEAAYLAKFGQAPGPFDAFAYDAVYVGVAAIEAVGNDGPAIKAWLETHSVAGRISSDTIAFNENGDVTTGGYGLWEVFYDGETGTFAPYTG